MYSGTPLYGHPYITENFGCLDRKLIYFLGQRTFSCVRNPNHKFPYVVNPAVRTLFICELYIIEYTGENLKEKRNDLSKSVLCNIQSTWLSRKLKPLVQSRGADSIVVFKEQCLGNDNPRS